VRGWAGGMRSVYRLLRAVCDEPCVSRSGHGVHREVRNAAVALTAAVREMAQGDGRLGEGLHDPRPK